MSDFDDEICFTVDVREIFKDGVFGDHGIGSRFYNEERSGNFKVVGIFLNRWTLYREMSDG